jgi:hypothetical protein
LKNDDAIINGALQSVVVSVFYFQQIFCHSSAQKIKNFLEFFFGGGNHQIFDIKEFIKIKLLCKNPSSKHKL